MAQPQKLSLTQFMSYSRTFWAGFGVFLVCATVYGLFTGLMSLLNQGVIPCPPVTPTFAFADGVMRRVPAAAFPTINTDPRPTSYTLQMNLPVVDNMPVWPRFGSTFNSDDLSLGVVPVYKLKPLAATFNADQDSRDIARKLGFSAIPQVLDAHTVSFSKTGPPLQETLNVDLQTMFVTLKTNALTTTNYFGTTSPTGERLVPDRVDALNATTAYLSKAGILPTDLSQSSAQADYYRSVGANLELVESEREADYVSVPLSHNPLTGVVNLNPLPGQCTEEETFYRFFGPNSFPSIRALVGRNRDGEDMVVDLENYYYDIDYTDVATYPLRSVAMAWQMLQAGDAYVMNPRGIQDAIITSVELGYYESHQEQEYLVPIFVFTGDNDVVAYVQALYPDIME